MSYPLNNVYVRDITPGLTPIFGTYGDTGAANKGAVATVLFAIKELGPPSNGKWWNGGSLFNLSSPLTSDNASLWASSWTYVNISTANMTSGTSYYVTVRSQDNAAPANDEGFFSVRSVTFTYDSGAPTVVLQAPTNGVYFSSVTALTISGTASEIPSGVQTVQVNIQNGGNYLERDRQRIGELWCVVELRNGDVQQSGVDVHDPGGALGGELREADRVTVFKRGRGRWRGRRRRSRRRTRSPMTWRRRRGRW